MIQKSGQQGFPHIGAAATEAEGLQARGFQSAAPRQDHQVGPGDRAAIFLLDRPEQAAGLVQVDVVGPAIERREALRAGGRAAAPVRIKSGP